ncbi:hypothetical protein [Aquitalea magnusonii]|uniref:hypothetical protein n=1 Tax=Aquitalea magnusonii TaxID=332411 RepID=UPI0011B6B3A2|nr:hypothetical protein [Aquitalea magnusonii]
MAKLSFTAKSTPSACPAAALRGLTLCGTAGTRDWLWSNRSNSLPLKTAAAPPAGMFDKAGGGAVLIMKTSRNTSAALAAMQTLTKKMPCKKILLMLHSNRQPLRIYN